MSQADVAADCLFCKIVSGEIRGTIVHRDDDVTAFRDIAPAAPTHILIVPNRHVSFVADFAAEDAALIGRLILTANAVARDEGLAERGYRLLFNNGPDSGQQVDHVHLHLLGGRRLGALLPGN